MKSDVPVPPAFCVYREFGRADSGTLRFDRHYLAYSASGLMRIEAASRLWSLQPTKAAWIPAGTEVSVDIPSSMTCCSVLFEPTFVDLPDGEVRTIELSPLARELILHCRRWGADGVGFDEAAARLFGVLASVVLELMRTPTGDWIPRGDTPLVSRAIDLTRERHAGALELGEIASALAVADRTLSRRVVEETGMTWGHVLRRVRIVRARELLATGELPITRVGAAVGYASQSAFNKAFRAESDMTPRAFQALHRGVSRSRT